MSNDERSGENDPAIAPAMFNWAVLVLRASHRPSSSSDDYPRSDREAWQPVAQLEATQALGWLEAASPVGGSAYTFKSGRQAALESSPHHRERAKPARVQRRNVLRRLGDG
jgi:hypothetical protein